MLSTCFFVILHIFGFQNFDCDPIFLRILGNRWLSVPPDSILGDSPQKSEGGLSGLCGVFWALDYCHPVPNESKSQGIQAEGTGPAIILQYFILLW